MSDRIEELRKKFDENPRRYFAPLANEYRKSGDIDQAIAICQEYLPLQPGHMSGHIVLGQALYEAGRLDEARTVFETALGLDPENLIALRHLGDIARDGGDRESARAWYERVLEADPRNEEISGLLAALDQAPETVEPAAAVAPPVSQHAPTPLVNPVIPFTPSGGPPIIERASEDAFSLSDVPTVEIPRLGAFGEPETPPGFTSMFEEPLETAPPETPVPEFGDLLAHAEAEAQAQAPAPPAPEPELLDFEMPVAGFEPAREPAHEEMAESVRAERLPDLETGMPGRTVAEAEREAAESGVEAVSGLEPTTFDEAESAATEAAAEAMGVTSPMDVDEAAERRTRALAGLPALDEGEPLEPVRTTTSGLPRDSAQLPGLEPTAVERPARGEGAGAGPGPREGAEGERRATPAAGAMFVTETMAELYLRQGHREEAIAVYRQLVEQRPGDEPLRARLAEVEGGGKAPTGPSIRDFLGAIALRRPGEGGNGSAPSHDERGAGASAIPGGSIDALFGGKGARHDDDAAQRLAAAFADAGVPESPIAGAPARQATSELSLDHVFRERGGTPAQGQPTFSFDQFFSQEAAEHGAAGEQGPGAAAPDDDIQQFNAWLEGLKKS